MAIIRNLDQISTEWTVLARAHVAPPCEAAEARRRVLERYAVAAFRYLRAVARGDENRAADLFQEFSLRFIRGDFRGADRSKGRFRTYLKASLIRLAAEMARKEKARGVSLGAGSDEPAAWSEGNEAEASFSGEWRATILARAWEALAERSARDGRPLDRALALRVDRPDDSSRRLAAEVATRSGRPLSANGFDKLVCEARSRFAELVVRAVDDALGGPNREELEAELIDLGLHAPCRAALRRFARP